MSGFWNELRASTEAENARLGEAYSRGENIVNMLQQAQQGNLNSSMQFSGMGQQGLLSAVTMAENSRQFDETMEQQVEFKALDQKHRIEFEILSQEHKMKYLAADNDAKRKLVNDEYLFRANEMIANQNHAYMMLKRAKDLGYETPPDTIYKNVYNPKGSWE